MDSALSVLQAIGAFLAGAAARLGIFVAALAVLAVPALLIALATRWLARVRRRALALSDAGGLLFSPRVWYAPGHTWLAQGAKKALRVGIDGLAQHLLPGAGWVELPRPGRAVREGEPVAAVSTGARTIAIASPVTGTVVAVNRAVLRDPTLVKRDGYARGWLFAVEPSDARHTLFPKGEPARDWLENEGKRLARFILEHSAAAADGGELVAQAPWLLPEEQWKELASAFLLGR